VGSHNNQEARVVRHVALVDGGFDTVLLAAGTEVFASQCYYRTLRRRPVSEPEGQE
jgi:hypothetical protein